MSFPYTTSIDALSGDQPAEKSAGVTATTTGPWIDISKRQAVSFVFRATGIASGNGVFSVDVSNDGTNAATGVALHDATQTAQATNVTSVTINSNTQAAYTLANIGFRYVRVKVTRTTDGTYFAAMESAG